MRKKRNKDKYCPCCLQKYTGKNPKTKHHIYPKRLFGHNSSIFYLCQNCHRILDNSGKWMEQTKTYTKEMCRVILTAFIKHQQVASRTS